MASHKESVSEEGVQLDEKLNVRSCEKLGQFSQSSYQRNRFLFYANISLNLCEEDEGEQGDIFIESSSRVKVVTVFIISINLPDIVKSSLNTKEKKRCRTREQGVTMSDSMPVRAL